MNARKDKIRCFVCDLRRVWHNMKHGKVAKWTLVVHFVYYGHATFSESGWHIVTSAACAAAILFDLFHETKGN